MHALRLSAVIAHRLRPWLAAPLLALGLSACATLPPPPERPATHAIKDPDATPIGQWAAQAAPRASLSGFRLLIAGEDAFDTLSALANAAVRTLDLQYYIVEDDPSSAAILERVHAAAERGVRVRILVDDLNTAGKDQAFLRLTAHPNMEVRLFNPFPAGRLSMVSRIMASLTDLSRINRRMHSKMFVADNAMAVTGGRNLGEAYFVHSATSNFLDLDVLAIGPVVRQLSASFDEFWNSPLAYPAQMLASPAPADRSALASVGRTGAERDAATAAAAASAAAPASTATAPTASAAAAAPAAAAPAAAAPAAAAPAAAAPAAPASPATAAPQLRSTTAASPPRIAPSPSLPTARDGMTRLRQLLAERLKPVWVPAVMVADKPAKIASETEPDIEETLAQNVIDLARSAKQEVILISPYFVPGDGGVALAESLRQRGVKLRVLTNSLAATDAPVVHIGYSRYRVPLLQAGVELHELRREIGAPRSRLGAFGSSQASLHVKAMVIDRSTVLVGSMNMDPRSALLNTELGLIIRSRALGRQLAELYEDVSANSSYRLSLDERGRLLWTAGKPPNSTVLDDEPDASLMLRFLLALLGPFAPEEML